MTEHEELRFYVAIVSNNLEKSINDVCKLLEQHLSPEAILRISNELSDSSVYDDGKHAKKFTFFINPYEVDSISWWHWYAGKYSN